MSILIRGKDILEGTIYSTNANSAAKFSLQIPRVMSGAIATTSQWMSMWVAWQFAMYP
jgi:hypothetical protein